MCLVIKEFIKTNLSNQILSIIENKSTSYKTLSEITKISLERITGFVNGTVMPTDTELITISKTFNIPVNLILRGITHSIECTNKTCIYHNQNCTAEYLLLDDMGQCVHNNVSKFGHIINKDIKTKNEHGITCNEIRCKNNINRNCILNRIFINTVGQCEEFKWRKNHIV